MEFYNHRAKLSQSCYIVNTCLCNSSQVITYSYHLGPPGCNLKMKDAGHRYNMCTIHTVQEKCSYTYASKHLFIISSSLISSSRINNKMLNYLVIVSITNFIRKSQKSGVWPAEMKEARHPHLGCMNTCLHTHTSQEH